MVRSKSCVKLEGEWWISKEGYELFEMLAKLQLIRLKVYMTDIIDGRHDIDVESVV